jgi:RNA polymerase sigma factor (sigma-70 family)
METEQLAQKIAEALLALKRERTELSKSLTVEENQLHERLYTLFQNKLKSYIQNRFWGNKDIAIYVEDIASAVWLSLLDDPMSWDPKTQSFELWFFYDHACDIGKKILRRFINCSDLHDVFEEEKHSPYKLSDALEIKADVEAAQSNLNELDRKLLHRRYIEDETQRDIAQSMNLSEPRITQLLKRARQHLKQWLDTYDPNHNR